MGSANELAAIGALIGNPARAAMLSLLFDGQAHAAAELARSAGVTPQTASWHLAGLTAGQLLAAEQRGRRRYYRLASPEVAQMLETVLVVATATPLKRGTPPRADAALRSARTCYDHLAGQLGVALADALVLRHAVTLSDDGGALTARGVELLSDLGVAVEAVAERRRAFCRPCLDWTERRPHIAGAIGAAIAERCFALGWITRTLSSRAVAITPAGRHGFGETFGIDSAVLERP